MGWTYGVMGETQIRASRAGSSCLIRRSRFLKSSCSLISSSLEFMVLRSASCSSASSFLMVRLSSAFILVADLMSSSFRRYSFISSAFREGMVDAEGCKIINNTTKMVNWLMSMGFKGDAGCVILRLFIPSGKAPIGGALPCS